MKYSLLLALLFLIALVSCQKEDDEIIHGEITDYPEISLMSGFNYSSGLPMYATDTVITDNNYQVGVHFSKNANSNKKLTRVKAYIHKHGYVINGQSDPEYWVMEEIAVIDSAIYADEFTWYLDGYFEEDNPQTKIFYLFFVYDEFHRNNSVNLNLFCNKKP